MVATTKEIKQFLGNIFYAKGKKFDESYLPMYVREISNIKPTAIVLHNAEKQIIREDVKLEVLEICNVINSQINLQKPRLSYRQTKCPYCKGKGIVVGIKFDKNGKYIPSAEYAINCVCGSGHIVDSVTMQEDVESCHKVDCKDGYYRIFTDVIKKFDYLKRVAQNKGYDILN